MQIKQNSKITSSDILVIPFFEEKKIPLSSVLKTIPELKSYIHFLHDLNDFSGKKDEMLLFYTPVKHFSRIMFLGLGKKEMSSDSIRKIAGKARKKMNGFEIKHIQVYLRKEISKESFLHPFLEGFLLGGYNFHFYKTDKQKESPQNIEKLSFFAPHISTRILKNTQEIKDVCNSNMYVRDLVNTPANELTPNHLALEAKKIHKTNRKIKVTIFNEKQLKKIGCKAILSVGQGSIHPPRLITLEYKSPKKNAKTIAIVGKGLTFDTGGINLKPTSGIGNMKCDMAGGATVLGIFKMLSEKHTLPINLIGVVGAAENAISHHATRPGDIISSYAGKTIEVTNTDAEGRLVLADALAYTLDKKKIDTIFDIATLTGACIAALGNSITGVMTNSENLMKHITKASKNVDEKVWQLPLNDEFIEKTKGDISDLKNYTPNTQGQAMMAAAFLSHFVSDTPWAHFDIAGTSWADNDSEYITKGGTGVLIKLLWNLLNNM